VPTSVYGATASTPSVESIAPLPSWSIPRLPSGTTVGPDGRTTVRLPPAPPPCPTTLIAMEAMPDRASDDATVRGAPCFESVKLCPKIATGQPPAGSAPDGRNSV
jgi:hypothetical protein